MQKRSYRIEKVADIIFLSGLCLMAIVCGLIAYELIWSSTVHPGPPLAKAGLPAAACLSRPRPVCRRRTTATGRRDGRQAQRQVGASSRPSTVEVSGTSSRS